jgi:multidrug efflux pump
MKGKLAEFMTIVGADPAVQSVAGYTGAGSGGGNSQTNTGSVYVLLKPLPTRKISSDEVIARLRPKLAEVAGGRLFLQTVQDIRIGARQANAQYQFTLQADKTEDLSEWGPKLEAALAKSPEIADVNSDRQPKGLETDMTFDRATAARLGLTLSQMDSTLYDAFGQRQVSTIFNALNQYHVVMEVAPRYWQSPETLKDIYISTAAGNPGGAATTQSSSATTTQIVGLPQVRASSTVVAGASNSVQNQLTNAIANTGRGSASNGAAVSASQETMVPLPEVSHYTMGTTRLAVNHQGLFAATTISFNLQPDVALSEATAIVTQAMQDIHMPTSVHGVFAGTAATFQTSLAGEPVLIAAALLAVYIVLGVLYESYIHPITIISTLPSAGVGAVLALMVSHTEFTIIALIGVILLIGIVKKNAIMMIDFAIHAERMQGIPPREAIYQACLLRFRPIMMTTLAALLGALPLAFSYGNGGELRRPLGISIVGGLILSQVLTLYTTPVLYVYLDRFQSACRRWWAGISGDDGAPKEALT